MREVAGAAPSGKCLSSRTPHRWHRPCIFADVKSDAKVIVVMPAYNAGRTLRMTYEELPKDAVSMVILVDDGSTDATLDIARQLGLEIFVHNRNYAYGANQKTCYAEALRAGADIVVMVH